MSDIRGTVLHPPELEGRYREQRLPRDFRHMSQILWITVVVIMWFTASDPRWSGGLLPASVTLARISIMLLSLGLLLYGRRGATVRGFDAWVFVWLNAVAIDLVLITLTRPTTHALNSVVVVMAIVAAHLVPAPLVSKLVPCSLATAGYAAAYVVSPVPGRAGEMAVIAATFGLAHAFGLIASIRSDRAGREQFLALIREQEAREELETAVAEIQTLQGIIPICSGCRKVRADSGYWEQVEEYVTRHTDADFSHGLCPDCSADLYPEYQGAD